MLVFALVLIAGGLLSVLTLALFVGDYIAPLACAALGAKLALASGGGWPGAIVCGAVVFAVVTTALRLTAAVARPLPVRLMAALILLAPAATVAFCLAEAALRPVVPSALWCTCLASLVAMCVTANGYRRHFPVLSVAEPDQRDRR